MAVLRYREFTEFAKIASHPIFAKSGVTTKKLTAPTPPACTVVEDIHHLFQQKQV